MRSHQAGRRLKEVLDNITSIHFKVLSNKSWKKNENFVVRAVNFVPQTIELQRKLQKILGSKNGHLAHAQ